MSSFLFLNNFGVQNCYIYFINFIKLQNIHYIQFIIKFRLFWKILNKLLLIFDILMRKNFHWTGEKRKKTFIEIFEFVDKSFFNQIFVTKIYRFIHVSKISLRNVMIILPRVIEKIIAKKMHFMLSKLLV